MEPVSDADKAQAVAAFDQLLGVFLPVVAMVQAARDRIKAAEALEADAYRVEAMAAVHDLEVAFSEFDHMDVGRLPAFLEPSR